MVVKWIVCRVPEPKRDAFAVAQSEWRLLQGTAGFLGQAGGWNVDEPTEACIVSLWTSMPHYEDFMARRHDEMLARTQQQQAYTRADVVLCERLLDIHGESGPFPAALPRAGLLRVADCQIHARRMSHFLKVQRDVWNPGMARVQGMLGGSFNWARSRDNQFVVITAWASSECHSRYMVDHFAELRHRSHAAQDIVQVTGRRVRLQPTWFAAP